MKSIHKTYRNIWHFSPESFVLAALTGFLYRVEMLYPLSGLLDLVNIRYAHSHLMFFSWISPPLMAWMANSFCSIFLGDDYRRTAGNTSRLVAYKECKKSNF